MMRKSDSKVPDNDSNIHEDLISDPTELLHQAILECDIQNVLKYISQGADLDRRINHATHWIFLKDHFNSLIFSDRELNALFFAIKFGDRHIVKMLIDHEADVNQQEVLSMTYFDYTAKANNVTSVPVTPLKYAAGLGHTDIVLLLLDSGAKFIQPNSIDALECRDSNFIRSGKYATDYALSFGKNLTAKLLYAKHPHYIDLHRLNSINPTHKRLYEKLIQEHLKDYPEKSGFEIIDDMSEAIAKCVFPDSPDKYALHVELLKYLNGIRYQILVNPVPIIAAPKRNDHQFESYKMVLVNAIRVFLKHQQPIDEFGFSICYHRNLRGTLDNNLCQNEINTKIFNIEDARIKALGLSLGECAGLEYNNAFEMFCDVFNLKSDEILNLQENHHLLTQWKLSLFASSFKVGRARTQVEGFEHPLLNRRMPGPIVPTATLLRYPQAARRHAKTLLDTIKSSFSAISVLKKRSADEMNSDKEGLPLNEVKPSVDQHSTELNKDNEPYPGASATAAAAYAAAMAVLAESEQSTISELSDKLTASDEHVDESESVSTVPVLSPPTLTLLSGSAGKQEQVDPISVDNEEDDGRAKPSPGKRRKID